MLDNYYNFVLIYSHLLDITKERTKAMMNIDQQRMQRVAQEAFNKVSGNRRREHAIARARVEIEENPFMKAKPAHHRAGTRVGQVGAGKGISEWLNQITRRAGCMPSF